MAAGDITDAIVVQVRERVGIASVAGLLEAEILSQLNRGQYDLGWRLADGAMPGLTGRTAGSLSSSRLALPSDFWRERLLEVGAVYAQRWNVSELANLADINPTASNVFYYIWYHTDGPYIIVELADATSTAAYVLYYLRQPPVLTTSVDPYYRAPLLGLLEDFAVAECLRLRQRWDEGQAVTTEYLRTIALINSRYTLGKPYEAEPGDPMLGGGP